MDKSQVNVEVKELPDMTVAYVRHIGPYKGDSDLFDRMFNKLFKWAGARDLLNFPETKTLAVYHDNPEAALIEAWTQWTIPLQAFADQGVDLANVDTIAIGFGDKNNLQAGGSGAMFFDDIRLYRPEPGLESEPVP